MSNINDFNSNTGESDRDPSELTQERLEELDAQLDELFTELGDKRPEILPKDIADEMGLNEKEVLNSDNEEDKEAIASIIGDMVDAANESESSPQESPPKTDTPSAASENPEAQAQIETEQEALEPQISELLSQINADNATTETESATEPQSQPDPKPENIAEAVAEPEPETVAEPVTAAQPEAADQPESIGPGTASAEEEADIEAQMMAMLGINPEDVTGNEDVTGDEDESIETETEAVASTETTEVTSETETETQSQETVAEAPSTSDPMDDLAAQLNAALAEATEIAESESTEQDNPADNQEAIASEQDSKQQDSKQQEVEEIDDLTAQLNELLGNNDNDKDADQATQESVLAAKEDQDEITHLDEMLAQQADDFDTADFETPEQVASSIETETDSDATALQALDAAIASSQNLDQNADEPLEEKPNRPESRLKANDIDTTEATAAAQSNLEDMDALDGSFDTVDEVLHGKQPDQGATAQDVAAELDEELEETVAEDKKPPQKADSDQDQQDDDDPPKPGRNIDWQSKVTIVERTTRRTLGLVNAPTWRFNETTRATLGWVAIAVAGPGSLYFIAGLLLS